MNFFAKVRGLKQKGKCMVMFALYVTFLWLREICKAHASIYRVSPNVL